jgi:hypothetical protein
VSISTQAGAAPVIVLTAATIGTASGISGTVVVRSTATISPSSLVAACASYAYVSAPS